MASYTPAAVIPITALTASAGTSLLTGVNATIYIMRTIHVDTNGTGKTFTLSIGADGVGTRLFDAYALTQSVPAIFNGWWLATSAGAAHTIDGNASATTANIFAGGYSYA